MVGYSLQFGSSSGCYSKEIFLCFIQVYYVDGVYLIVRVEAHRIVDDSEEEPRQEVDGKVAGLLPSHQHDQ